MNFIKHYLLKNEYVKQSDKHTHSTDEQLIIQTKINEIVEEIKNTNTNTNNTNTNAKNLDEELIIRKKFVISLIILENIVIINKRKIDFLFNWRYLYLYLFHIHKILRTLLYLNIPLINLFSKFIMKTKISNIKYIQNKILDYNNSANLYDKLKLIDKKKK